MSDSPEQVEKLREQAALVRQAAQYAEGPAYHNDIKRADDLSRQASAMEQRLKQAAEARKRDLAQIHMAKHDLAMAEDSYRALLLRMTDNKKISAKDFSARERAKLLAEFKRLGWKPKRSRQYSPKSRGMAGKIRALWIGLYKAGHIRDGSERALGRWLNRHTGRHSPEWLTTADASRAIEALKGWKKRLEQEVK